MPEPLALLRVSTVARRLDCSPKTVRRRIAEGKIPAVLEGGRTMVRSDVLQRYMEDSEPVPATLVPVSRPRPRALVATTVDEFDFLRA